MSTTLMIRPGFEDKEVPANEVQGHLMYGWEIKGEEKAPAGDLDPKPISSLRYGANPVNIKKLKSDLAGKSIEEIEAAFEGEGREKLLAVKTALLEELSKSAPAAETDGKPISSTDFADDEEGMNALREAVKEMTPDQIIDVFENEKRESVLKVYTEITE